jgi:hypothetical protein
MKPRFVVPSVSALLLVSLVGCRDKASPPADAQPQKPEVASGAAEPAEQAPQEAPTKRRPLVYEGMVEMKLGEELVSFEHVDGGRSHLTNTVKLRSLMLFAQRSAGASEGLVITVRGHDFERVQGQELSHGRVRGVRVPKSAVLVYTDAEGARFDNSGGAPFGIGITSYARDESIEGVFSGTLSERGGDRTLEIEDGRFTLRAVDSDE